MKISDIQVGMKLQCTYNKYYPIITVTEITDKGFKYTHENRFIKTEGVPDPITKGECYALDGDVYYEPYEEV